LTPRVLLASDPVANRCIRPLDTTMNEWMEICRFEALLSAMLWTILALLALGWACAGATTGSSLDRPWAPNPHLY